MNYCGLDKNDIANGPGVRVSLFVSGCTHHCKNCFNPETWDFKYGKPFDKKAMCDLKEALKPDYVSGLSILGGDPMHPCNQAEVCKIVTEIKKDFPQKNIWLWTGYVWEDLKTSPNARTEHTEKIFENIDVLVDGLFVEDLKDLSLKFRGSSNQRLIDVKQSLNSRKVIETE